MNLKPTLAHWTIVLYASSAAVLAPAAEYDDAAANRTQPSPLFLKLDANHDGYVSSSEAKGLRGFARAFADADVNNDRRLDPDEFIKAQAIHERIQLAQYAEDSVITAKVKAALLRDLELEGLEVSVETYRGRVLLSGYVDNERQAQRALHVAAGVRGVTRVDDALRVK